MAKRICGIDPGNGGALALLIDDKLHAVEDMPVIEVNGKRRINAAVVTDIVVRYNADLTVIGAARLPWPTRSAWSFRPFSRAVRRPDS
mgnify:CR=1 FL=1